MTLLHEAGIDAATCLTSASVAQSLGDSVSMVVASEEAMRLSDTSAIRAWIEAQAPWSDLPFIVFTQRGGGPDNNPATARLAETFGNVTFLERPFHPTTFASIARTALKARRRQYEARDRLEELNESQERLATAMLAGRLGSWSIDVDTRVLETSALCREIYGYRADEQFTYDNLLAMIHPADAPAMQEAVRRSVDDGEDYNIDYRTRWRDGTEHWVQVNGRVLKNPDGSTRGLVGVAMDITARRQAENALRDTNETLERRVTERTRELERTHDKVLAEIRQREKVEDQLRQAQNMEIIGQLTGGVAHDFNNLLMAVLSNLDLLRKHVGDDARATRFIDSALQGAKRGAALTQRLLAFARRQSLKVEPASISALAEDMRDLLERSVGQDIELHFKSDATAPMALVDSNQVELALLNLVVNARDAMPEGGRISIEVDAKTVNRGEDLKPGKYVRLSVVDTGSGMDEETLQRAIEPFFSTKELGKGTGLGLSMIHGLAVQLNGALRLSSKPGKGTRAELYFPVTHAQVEVVEEAPVEPESLTAGPAKILIVDDDVLIAMSTVDMLVDLGHEVIEANSGASALEVLRSVGDVDLMITDFSMPGMNGAQLAAEARRLKPAMPILLATGYAEMPTGTSVDLPRLGKPYSQSQLAREIGRLLQNAPAR